MLAVSESSSQVVVVGTDDGKTFFSLSGTIIMPMGNGTSSDQAARISVDFAAKSGGAVGMLTATFTCPNATDGSPSASSFGRLVWADGNAWWRLAAPPAMVVDATPPDAATGAGTAAAAAPAAAAAAAATTTSAAASDFGQRPGGLFRDPLHSSASHGGGAAPVSAASMAASFAGLRMISGKATGAAGTAAPDSTEVTIDVVGSDLI
eukprot:g3090.t1